MDQATIWFLLIAVLWTGFLALEGFDFGVAMLLPILGRTGPGESETETGQDRRRVMLTTIGPHWDGNEVWLITAVGAMFAAFPAWYATMFSAFYLPTLLLLLGLIARGIGLEYRHKRHDRPWERRCDVAIIGGSVTATAVIGFMLTTLIRGLPLDTDARYVGTPASLFSWVGLLGAVAMVALAITHGAMFLALKTNGPISEDARRVASRVGWLALVSIASLLGWLIFGSTPADQPTGAAEPAAWIVAVVAIAAILAALIANRLRRTGLAFAATMAAWIAVGASFFLALSPNTVPTTLADGASLSLVEAASTSQTLQIMTVAAAIVMPIMLCYTGFSYWVFRRRISVRDLPPRKPIQPAIGRS